jgi:hypothetical protein
VVYLSSNSACEPLKTTRKQLTLGDRVPLRQPGVKDAVHDDVGHGVVIRMDAGAGRRQYESWFVADQLRNGNRASPQCRPRLLRGRPAGHQTPARHTVWTSIRALYRRCRSAR